MAPRKDGSALSCLTGESQQRELATKCLVMVPLSPNFLSFNLSRIQDSMKSVIVSAPDYESLQMILTARRLYQKTEPVASEKQDMNRRFVEGYKRLLLQVKGQPSQE